MAYLDLNVGQAIRDELKAVGIKTALGCRGNVLILRTDDAYAVELYDGGVEVKVHRPKWGMITLLKVELSHPQAIEQIIAVIKRSRRRAYDFLWVLLGVCTFILVTNLIIMKCFIL
jgi:hypothetical protein